MADEEKKEEFPSLDDFWSSGGAEEGQKPEGGAPPAAAPAPGGESAPPAAAPAAGGGGATLGDMNLESGWDEALKDMTSAEPRPAPPQAEKKVQAKAFDTIEAVEPEPGAHPRNLEIILDIPMEITAELGKTRIMVQDFLRLGMGSIIELQKAAGEPVEILVNGTLVARGEVVVVNDRFGVRLTDIISQAERIKKLA